MTIARTALGATLFLALIAPAAGLAQAPKPSKKLYCWDENGRRVCGDALPADAVDSARTEISARSGLPTARMSRALTPEERLAAEAAARQAAIDAAAREAAQRRDIAMVESYNSEAELRRAFQHRITLMEETVQASLYGIKGLRQSLVSLLRRAGQVELAGEKVPRDLAATIRTQHEELMRQQALLVEHRRNRREVEGDLTTALERYRDMTAGDEAATGG
ncbi:hypothetical protein [Lysobacter sp. A3-1-A15]|uniref:hypothetical protein n=1 Tax=Novilysobacter viscosus TaxID=3098602 RepID=UPI002ED78607